MASAPMAVVKTVPAENGISNTPTFAPNLRVAALSDTPIHVLWIYLFISVILPGSLLSGLGIWPNYYRYESFSLIPGTILIGAIVFSCAFRHIHWSNINSVVISDRHIFIFSSQKIRIAILAACLALSLFNAIQGNNGWRYSDTSLSEEGSFSLYFYIVVTPVARLFLLFHAFIYKGNSKFDKFEKFLVTIILAISINGNMSAFLAVFSLLILQLKADIFLFQQRVTLSNLAKFIGTSIVIIIMLVAAYVVGESVKRGDSLFNVFDWLIGTSANGEAFDPISLIERLSPSYVSLANALPATLDWDRVSFGNLIGVINNLLFRLDALGLTNFGVERGSAITMARFNYEAIDIFAAGTREGTAPGYIPGFIYCFPPYLNVLMLCAYTFLVLSLLQRLCLCLKANLSIIGKIIFAYFALPLFDSPLDTLIFIDDGFIYFMGFWWMGYLIKQERGLSSYATEQSAI